MENLSDTLQRKLVNGGWRFDQLPIRDDATSWKDVKEECGFSSAELSELKNARCPGKLSNSHIRLFI
jgi:hypothetical protein